MKLGGKDFSIPPLAPSMITFVLFAVCFAVCLLAFVGIIMFLMKVLIILIFVKTNFSYYYQKRFLLLNKQIMQLTT